MNQKIIAQGAEAIILLNKDTITKKRIPKGYRIKELDEKIRKLRTRSETKLLEKASKIIPVPTLMTWDEKTKEISMEFIDGEKLSEKLNKFQLKKQKEICKKIGENISKLHDSDIIHGDLTTSNMILKNDKVFFIDFGLGFISRKIEDKAVDLHLLKEALKAKHFEHWQELFKEIIGSYNLSKNSKKILLQFEKVEKRGRYKEKY